MEKATVDSDRTRMVQHMVRSSDYLARYVQSLRSKQAALDNLAARLWLDDATLPFHQLQQSLCNWDLLSAGDIAYLFQDLVGHSLSADECVAIAAFIKSSIPAAHPLYQVRDRLAAILRDSSCKPLESATDSNSIIAYLNDPSSQSIVLAGIASPSLDDCLVYLATRLNLELQLANLFAIGLCLETQRVLRLQLEVQEELMGIQADWQLELQQQQMATHNTRLEQRVVRRMDKLKRLVETWKCNAQDSEKEAYRLMDSIASKSWAVLERIASMKQLHPHFNFFTEKTPMALAQHES
ncbi:hypothetical protein HDU91_004461 [Kappamyces sp. JEL0680]|nr:hypothetical protein HDU91_004461 [Kappamyces sp. JEL0680]